ncbi:MAG: AMP-binding protein, partial [Actinomycetota bacterium]
MERPWFAHYDEGVTREAGYPEGPVWHLLERSAREYPKARAVEFLGFTMSYAQVWRDSLRFAGALRAMGVKPGDRVALMLPNSPQYVVAFYGALEAGATLVNTSPLYTPRELSEQLKDSGAETLVILDLLWPTYEKVKDEVPVKRVITTGVQDYLPFPKNLLFPIKVKREGRWVNLPSDPRRHDFKRLLKTHGPLEQPHTGSLDDVALLQYTGGTTGTPKGAMLTHRNLLANAHQVLAWLGDRLEPGGEVVLAVIPFFHIYGVVAGLLVGVSLGARMVLMPRPDYKMMVKAIEKQRATIFPGVPTMFIGLNNYPGIQGRNLKSLKFCVSAAAPLPLEVSRQFEQLTGAKLVEGYGLTEASPTTHINPIYGKRKEGSIGLPLPSLDARIVDPNQVELPLGEVGELAVQGPNVMKG